MLGDKVAARRLAREAGIPILSGSDAPVQPGPEAHAVAESLGYPIIVKASMGGGGRGMRVVESADALDAALDQARREAGTAFGVPDVFIEKFLRRAKHIEVQILGDRHGRLLHLYERDCSVQRRHQKIVEIAPAPNLDPAIRQAICDAAVAIGRHVGYENAGTVEFLVDVNTGDYYFIEVNPRIQVEHTVTEIVTGVDLVKSQIMIAGGDRSPTRRSPCPTRPRSRCRDTRFNVGSRRRTPRIDSRPTMAGSPTTGRSAGWASGPTADRPSRAGSSRRSTTRCW